MRLAGRGRHDGASPVGRRSPGETKYGKESENEPHGHSPRPILM